MSCSSAFRCHFAVEYQEVFSLIKLRIEHRLSWTLPAHTLLHCLTSDTSISDLSCSQPKLSTSWRSHKLLIVLHEVYPYLFWVIIDKGNKVLRIAKRKHSTWTLYICMNKFRLGRSATFQKLTRFCLPKIQSLLKLKSTDSSPGSFPYVYKTFNPFLLMCSDLLCHKSELTLSSTMASAFPECEVK